MLGKPLVFFGSHCLLLMAMAAVADAATPAQPSPPLCTAAVSGSDAKTYQVAGPSGNDNAQIQCAIDQAISDLQTGVTQSAMILLQPNARYRLEPPPRYYNALSIKTSDLTKRNFSKLTFNGQGATLSLAPTAAGLYVNGCEDCTLENFTLQTEPSPMVEGTLVSSTSSSLDIRVTKGEVFTVPQGYRPIIGKNARAAIFQIADNAAFPTRQRFPASVPLVRMLSASNPSPGIIRVEYDSKWQAPPAPPEATVVSLVKPPLDAGKAAAMADVLRAAAVTRRDHPDYGPVFFTGSAVAALFVEQNKNLTVRNLRISDFPGQGIHAEFNRGQLVFDGIRIVPGRPGGLRSIGADGFMAKNNQTGPRITNSLIQNVGDDAIALANLSFFARHAKANVADLFSERTILHSITISPGDRFNVIDSATGRGFGTFTVVAAKAFAANERNYGYRVTFDRELPAEVERQDASSNPIRFINLDQANKDAVVRDNLIMGSERNGVVVSSSATVENNLFVGLALRAIGYIPFLVKFQVASGMWGDFGPVTIRNNSVIDVAQGLLRMNNTGAPRNYGVKPGGVTVTNNTVIAATNNYAPFYAVHIDNTDSVSTTAGGNTLIVPDTINRSTAVQFMAGNGAPDAWKDAFPVLLRKPEGALWDLKCQTVSSSPVWKSLMKAAVPDACP